ncbi:hypothetical protein DMH03_35335 [Amycolatopsis sp. WAC 01376]|nr:hypothetical protein DMH03_35335 [Amycolatopsis sp. WAC 01376]
MVTCAKQTVPRFVSLTTTWTEPAVSRGWMDDTRDQADDACDWMDGTRAGAGFRAESSIQSRVSSIQSHATDTRAGRSQPALTDCPAKDAFAACHAAKGAFTT